MCRKEEETLDHLLDRCEFASMIWVKAETRFRRTDKVLGHPDHSISDWCTNTFGNPLLNQIWELFPRFVVWELWKERNSRIFEGKDKSLEGVWLMLDRHLNKSLKLSSRPEEAK